MAKDLLFRVPNGVPLDHGDVDFNFDRLMHWSGEWVAGTYTHNEVVTADGILWVCIAASTTQQPAIGAGWTLPSDWDILAWTTPGIGQMNMATPVVGPDLGIGWTKIDWYDTEPFTSLFCTMTPATGNVQVAEPGLWELTLVLGLNHNNSNSGRTVNVRLNSAGGPGNGVAFGIARNVDDTFVTLPVWASFDDTQTGIDFWLEIGGGDLVTAVTWSVTDLRMKKLV